MSEALIACFWMKAFALGARLWIEYVDSGGNWSDGISREFAEDTYSREHHFQTRGLEEPLKWFTTDVNSAWDNTRKPRGADTEPDSGVFGLLCGRRASGRSATRFFLAECDEG